MSRRGRLVYSDRKRGQVTGGHAQQFLRAKWLDQVATSTRQATFYMIENAIARRENHYSHLIKRRMALQQVEQIKSINAGEIDVQKNEIRWLH